MAEVSLSKFELRRTSLLIEQLAIFSDMSGTRSMSWHATRGTGLVVVVAVTASRLVGSVLTSRRFSTCGSTSTSFSWQVGLKRCWASRSCKLNPARCSQCGRTLCQRFTAQTQGVRIATVIRAFFPALCSLMASPSMTFSRRPSSPSGALEGLVLREACCVSSSS